LGALLRRRKAARSREVAVARAQNGDRESKCNTSRAKLSAANGFVHLRRFLSYFLLLMVSSSFCSRRSLSSNFSTTSRATEIPFLIVVSIFSDLAPYLSYATRPLAALVAVLVTLGLMSKNNEVVACKPAPSVFIAWRFRFYSRIGALRCYVHSGRYLPALCQSAPGRTANQIKGRPAQTYTRRSVGFLAKIQNL